MRIGRRRGRPAHEDVLTPAEWRVVHAAQHGMTNREIARRRGVSPDAVKFHLANAFAKLGLAGRRPLRLWFRPPADSALGHKETDLSQPSALGPIRQIARTVADTARSEAWYRDVLRLPHLYTFGELCFFDCGGTRLMLTGGGSPSPNESILYLAVDDIVATHAALAVRGVEFINAPHLVHRHADGTEEWLAMFKDPEGRPLGIMAQVRP